MCSSCCFSCLHAKCACTHTQRRDQVRHAICNLTGRLQPLAAAGPVRCAQALASCTRQVPCTTSGSTKTVAARSAINVLSLLAVFFVLRMCPHQASATSPGEAAAAGACTAASSRTCCTLSLSSCSSLSSCASCSGSTGSGTEGMGCNIHVQAHKHRGVSVCYSNCGQGIPSSVYVQSL
jgi:hypothetical protein